MLETLGAVLAVLFLLGLFVFSIRMLAYIFSSRRDLEQRIDQYSE